MWGRYSAPHGKANAVTTAYLGFQIDSSDAPRAAVNLDTMNKAAGRAEVGQENLAKATRQSSGAIASQAKAANNNARATNALASASVRLGAITGRQRFIIQNTANQFGDLAVQLSSGTSASRALSQQLPQLLGGFGAFGAILGTVAAIGIPLATMFFTLGDSAEEAGDKAETLADHIALLDGALKAYEEAAEAARRTTSDLAADYGMAAGQARLFLEQQQSLARVEALAALTEAVRNVGMEYSDLFETIARADDLEDRSARNRAALFRESRRAFADLAESYGITNDQARRFVDLLNEAKAANTLDDQADAVRRMREFLVGAVGGVEDMNASARRLYGGMLDIEKSAAQLNAELGNTPGILAAATAQADALSAAVATAANAAASLAASQAQALATSQIRLQFAGDPVGSAGALAGQRFDNRVGDISGLDPIVQEGLARQRQELVANARAAAQNVEALSEWQRAQRQSAGAATRKASAAQKLRDKYADLTKSARDFIAEQELERRTIGMPEGIATQFRKERELLNAAIRAGRDLTPGLYSEIEKLARGYADAAMQTKAARAAQEAYQESVRFAREVTGGFILDLRSGLRQGESFWQAFGNAALNVLDRITDRLLNQVLDTIFQVNNAASRMGGGGGILGWLGNLFGGGFGGGFRHTPGVGLFAQGGYTGNGPRTAVAGVVHGQEFVMNAAATARYRPQLEAMNAGRMTGNANAPSAANGNYAPTFSINISGEGLNERQVADMVVARIADYDARLTRSMPRRVGAALPEARGRRWGR